MHCSACAKTIEKVVQKLDGVENVQVNFAIRKAQVLGDVSADLVVRTIVDAGYTAELFEKQHATGDNDYVRSEQDQLIRHLIIGGAFAILMAYFMLIDLTGRGVLGAHFIAPYMPLIAAMSATAVQVVVGRRFYVGFLKGLRMRSLNMDSLISIGTTVAYLYSLCTYLVYIFNNHTLLSSMDAPIHNLYFETSVFLIVFVTFGKTLEARAISKATSAISELIKLQPKIAHLITDTGLTDIEVDKVLVGMRLKVLPGEQIPVDGIILDGVSAVDESMITGESIAVDKVVGDEVIGGTINGTGAVEFEVKRVGSKTQLSRIIQLVEQAQLSKAPIEALSDKISAWFVPFVLFSSLVTFIVWYFILHAQFSDALMAFVSVVVIACPCALGLATGTAVIVGTGRGSALGIIIKGGQPLQKLSKVDTVVFDKTGTLTVGEPVVVQVLGNNNSNSSADNQAHILQICASLEASSEHSLAKAVLKEAENRNIQLLNVQNFFALAGKGIQGDINGTVYYFGTERLLSEIGVIISACEELLMNAHDLEHSGCTVAWIFSKNEVLGCIALLDEIRDSSAQVIKELKKLNVASYLLSGDNAQAVKKVSSTLGIDKYFAGVLPEEKARQIERLQRQGLVVAMIGDGINDAPALATADIGIAMGCGTDVALESADVVLASSDLYGTVASIKLARAVVQKIYQNLFFSLFYNVIGIPLAAGVFISFGLGLRPEIAGLAMALSSVSVVVNSLTLRAFSPRRINVLSIIAPLLMLALFGTIFVGFSHF
jgi:Cu+-exporting ATPase